MKALTVLQPWATCIARHGKDVENRTWEPKRLRHGDRIAIHAGLHFDTGGFFHKAAPLVPAWQQFLSREGMAFTKADGSFLLARSREAVEQEHVVLPRGAVVAVAQFCGATDDPEGLSRWADPRAAGWGWYWLLGAVVALPDPVPCRGAQGLWTLPPDVEARVLAQIGA